MAWYVAGVLGLLALGWLVPILVMDLKLERWRSRQRQLLGAESEAVRIRIEQALWAAQKSQSRGRRRKGGTAWSKTVGGMPASRPGGVTAANTKTSESRD